MKSHAGCNNVTQKSNIFKYDYNSDWDVPKDWMDQTIIEILEQVDDHQDPIKFIKDEMTTYIFDAYDDSCTFPKIYKALKYIRKKYNRSSNYRVFSDLFDNKIISYHLFLAVLKNDLSRFAARSSRIPGMTSN